MDKKFFLGLFTGCLLMFMSFSLYFPQISEAIYSIPPTDAWRTIGVSNEAVFPIDSQPTVNATSYRDTLYLVSDGSILINITEFTP